MTGSQHDRGVWKRSRQVSQEQDYQQVLQGDGEYLNLHRLKTLS